MLRVNFSYNPHPRMLHSEGYDFYSCATVKGEIPGVTDTARKFNFDRSYVIAYIIAKLIKPLFVLQYEDLEPLIREAWNEYQKELQETD